MQNNLISHINLRNFRNYEYQSISFTDGLNLIRGDNGQGKTNLAEAIYFLSGFGSHRTYKNQPLIKSGEQKAEISAKIQSKYGTRNVYIGISCNSNNILKVDGKPSKLRDLVSVFSCVIFSPEDIDLVKGDPGHRRKYLDDIICRVRPMMLDIYSAYDRTLKQRNSLLKSFRKSSCKSDLLDVWTQKLVELGLEIVNARKRLLKILNPKISEFYSKLAGVSSTAELFCQSSDCLIDTFDLLRDREIEEGVTLAGPHRDNVDILLNSCPARSQSSQGESWTLALSMKLSLIELMRETKRLYDPDPVVILDDVFAHLDSYRKQKLAQEVFSYEQTIVTTTDNSDNYRTSQTLVVEEGKVFSENKKG